MNENKESKSERWQKSFEKAKSYSANHEFYSGVNRRSSLTDTHMLDQRSEFPHQFPNGACNMKFAITYLLVASSALLIEDVKSFQLTDKKNFKFRKKLQHHHQATSNRRHQLNGIENTDRGFANFFDGKSCLIIVVK